MVRLLVASLMLAMPLVGQSTVLVKPGAAAAAQPAGDTALLAKAKHGDAAAQVRLGLKYEQGVGVRRDYPRILKDLKARIQNAQRKAALVVNLELVFLYWEIGCVILQRQTTEGWGAKVIERLSLDLRNAFPDVKGFSPRNLKYMKDFATVYPGPSILQQPAAKLPWTHLCLLLDKVKDSEARAWYIQATLENG